MKKIWDAINGKKTVVGGVLHAAWFIANILLKDLSTPGEAMTGHGIIFTITGVGIGHKIEKAIHAKK